MKPRLHLTALLALFLPVFLSAEVRTWTNQEGDEIEAEYVSQEDGEVTIRRIADQRVFRITIDTLSEDDRAWLEQADAPEGVGIYIAAGNGAHRMSSLDGITWTNHEFIDEPGHDQNDLKDMESADGVCVVVGGFSKSNIFTTTDGVNWEKNPFNIGVLSGVTHHDGRFIAFGEGGRIAASPDGVTWETIGDAKLRDHLDAEAEKLGEEGRIKSNIRAWRRVGDTFVGSGDNGFLITTTDFENWTFPPRIEPRSRLYIEEDGNGFVVYGRQTVHHSTDGVTWTNVTPEIGEKTRFRSLTHDGERFLLNESGGQGWESPDGIEWSVIEDATFPMNVVALRPDLYYSYNAYYKYTEDLKYSTDGGETWESAVLPAPAGVTNIVFAPEIPHFAPSEAESAEE